MSVSLAHVRGMLRRLCRCRHRVILSDWPLDRCGLASCRPVLISATTAKPAATVRRLYPLTITESGQPIDRAAHPAESFGGVRSRGRVG